MAVKALKASIGNNGKPVDESTVLRLLSQSQSVSDVFHIGETNDADFGLFTKDFCDLLLEELDYLNNSGIPMRRPNGMNRYGAILGRFSFSVH